MLVFRGITAAASLKGGHREALPAQSRCVFRGITAAASLKEQDRRVGSHGSGPGLPRHHCRGLIEGTLGAPKKKSGWAVFRGITAAASLKDYILAILIGDNAAVFRGITAAASLKDI